MQHKDNKLKPNSFIWRYWWSLPIIVVVVMVILFGVIYAIFLLDGPFPTGGGLSKNDWLGFTGGFLAFGGTVFVGFVAIFQNVRHEREERCRRKVERQQLIRPVLSASIVGTDRKFFQNTTAYSKATVQYPGSVEIKITNAGKYPICNVIVFNRYVKDLVLPNESFTVVCGFENVPRGLESNPYVIPLGGDDFESDSDGFPKWFNVSYIDIDGEEWFQTIKLHKFVGMRYYGLDAIESP